MATRSSRVQSLCYRLVAGIWRSLEIWTSGTLECCKQSLEDSFDWFSEDQNASTNRDNKDGPHEVSMRTRFCWELG